MSEQKPNKDPKTGKLLPGHEIRKTSGAWIWFRTGRVPEIKGRRRLQKHLNDLRTKLMEVVPNSSDPRRELVIAQVLKAEGFLVLIESYLKKSGIVDPTALQQGRLETQGALGQVISFMNCQLRSLQALGLDREQAEKVLAPYEIVQKEEREKKPDGHSNGSA